MSPHDQKNIDFILAISLDRDAMLEWYSGIDADDRAYALEILAQASKENETILHGDNLADAKQLLSKFTLKGIK